MISLSSNVFSMCWVLLLPHEVASETRGLIEQYDVCGEIPWTSYWFCTDLQVVSFVALSSLLGGVVGALVCRTAASLNSFSLKPCMYLQCCKSYQEKPTQHSKKDTLKFDCVALKSWIVVISQFPHFDLTAQTLITCSFKKFRNSKSNSRMEIGFVVLF